MCMEQYTELVQRQRNKDYSAHVGNILETLFCGAMVISIVLEWPYVSDVKVLLYICDFIG